MKRQNQRLAGLAILLSAFFLYGCGSGESVGGFPGGYGPGGCINLTQTNRIPFQATGAYFDSANIIAGKIPFAQQVGQTATGGPNTGGPYAAQSVDGTISMSIQPQSSQQQTPYPQYPQSTYWYQSGYQSYMPNPGPSYNTGIQGFIELSQSALQDIYYNFGGGSQWGYGQPTYSNYYWGSGWNGGYNHGFSYPGAYPQQPTQQQNLCVSGIALNLGHYNTQVYGGYVYLYMNSTEHGYILYF